MGSISRQYGKIFTRIRNGGSRRKMILGVPWHSVRLKRDGSNRAKLSLVFQEKIDEFSTKKKGSGG